jgi:TetR/AcrR family transcriptional regulator, transcriptional repressor for nem operon
METRTKILNSAQRLIQTRSFEGFSFQDIADEVGIRKASLYHHFDSKDAVAIGVLKRGADWVTGQLDATKELAPPERLERYFDLFHDLHGKAERMCPGGSFASVLGAVSPAVQRALHAFTKMHLDWLEGVVREGAELGAFEIGEQAPRDVALQIFSSVQGALLTGRLTADPGVLDAVATELRTYLRYTPKGREGGSKPA